MPKAVYPRATRYPLAVVLQFPYHPDLIEAIKRAFSPVYRSYDPAAKVWTIKEPWGDRAIALLREFYPEAVVQTFGGRQEQHRAHSRAPYARPDHYSALHLLPTAPPEVVRAAYNALVKRCHPDVLPIAERQKGHHEMLALNAAIEALRAEGAA